MAKTIVYSCDRKGCGKTPAQTTRITSDAGVYKVDLCVEHTKDAVEGATRQKRRQRRSRAEKPVIVPAVGSTGHVDNG